METLLYRIFVSLCSYWFLGVNIYTFSASLSTKCPKYEDSFKKSFNRIVGGNFARLDNLWHISFYQWNWTRRFQRGSVPLDSFHPQWASERPSVLWRGGGHPATRPYGGPLCRAAKSVELWHNMAIKTTKTLILAWLCTMSLWEWWMKRLRMEKKFWKKSAMFIQRETQISFPMTLPSSNLRVTLYSPIE